MKFTGGLPETLCGTGSTLAATEQIRSFLPGLLHKLDCRTLVDAPCGDLNWISRIDLSSIDYIGVDVEQKNIEAANDRLVAMSVATASIRRCDIINEIMPTGDVVLCRDFLQHIPTPMAQNALRNIAASGAKWLLATSHGVDQNEELEQIGGFRPLNLLIEPFGLMSKESFADCGRSLIVVEIN